jgi:hypothetical protein
LKAIAFRKDDDDVTSLPLSSPHPFADPLPLPPQFFYKRGLDSIDFIDSDFVDSSLIDTPFIGLGVDTDFIGVDSVNLSSPLFSPSPLSR